MKPVSVCIVDDNEALRAALKEIILLTPGYQCVASLASVDEAISKIPRLRPDVVLMDINLGTPESGIDCIRALKPHLPETNFMICTVYEDDENIFEALQAGASGYILKKTSPAKLLSAIRELSEGGAPMSSQIARRVVLTFQERQVKAKNNDLSNLSTREKEILELLSQGLMYKEIASKLFISPETVRKHVYHVYDKLHVNNRVAAVNKFYGR